MGLRKWLGLCEHEWDKWETIMEQWTRTRYYGDYEYNFTKTVQTRECKLCGKMQRKEIVK